MTLKRATTVACAARAGHWQRMLAADAGGNSSSARKQQKQLQQQPLLAHSLLTDAIHAVKFTGRQQLLQIAFKHQAAPCQPYLGNPGQS